MIIVLDGADGAGKATQSKILAERLSARLFSFPAYETPTGRLILGHLKKHWETCYLGTGDDGGDEYYPTGHNAQVFQCLQTVNRLELLPEIQAAAVQGHVVFDRYSASAMVYGKLDGLDPKWIERINSSLPQPDIQIFF
jgi:thymidylate kinase